MNWFLANAAVEKSVDSCRSGNQAVVVGVVFRVVSWISSEEERGCDPNMPSGTMERERRTVMMMTNGREASSPSEERKTEVEAMTRLPPS